MITDGTVTLIGSQQLDPRDRLRFRSAFRIYRDAGGHVHYHQSWALDRHTMFDCSALKRRHWQHRARELAGAAADGAAQRPFGGALPASQTSYASP
jgi:hypothetical protein